ncbi:MAG: hypothetical protein J6A92_03710 [Lachnospiraceae bacterium]|nr:hypothetical protein [Lachnospiraceae bacterium]
MIKRILYYQNMLSSSFSKDTVNGKMPGGKMLIFVVCISFFSGLFNQQLGSFAWLLVVIYGMGINFIENGSSRLLRTLPVSDEFAVAGRMFVYPVYFGGLICMGLLIVSIGLTGFIEGDFHALSAIRNVNLKGCIFSILLAMGVWFWLCLAAFHKNVKVRRIWYISIGILCLAGFFLKSKFVEGKGIQVTVAIADLPDIFPVMPTMLAGIVFAVGSGIFAWHGCLKLYRADITGQAKSIDMQDKKDETYINEVKALTTKVGKRKRGILLVLSVFLVVSCLFIVFTALGAFVSTGDGQMVDIETSSPMEYENWDTYAEKAGVDADLWKTGECIFPQKMEEEYIVEYYVKIDGSFKRESWSSIEKLRFMVAALPEDMYEKEKERIGKISITCPEDGVKENVNTVVHNTEDFPLEAYIAVYEMDCEYEYALFDDEKKQIIYVLSTGAELQKIPTQRDFYARFGANVISVFDANTDAKGYSIYTFKDEIWGFQSVYY